MWLSGLPYLWDDASTKINTIQKDLPPPKQRGAKLLPWKLLTERLGRNHKTRNKFRVQLTNYAIYMSKNIKKCTTVYTKCLSIRRNKITRCVLCLAQDEQIIPIILKNDLWGHSYNETNKTST